MQKTGNSNYQINTLTKKLPKGWSLTPLNQIAKINPRILDIPIKNLEKLEVSFIPMKNVEEESGRIDLSIKKMYNEVKKGYTPFINDDILFAKITPCMENGKVAVANNLQNGIGFGSTEFHVIRLLSNELSKKYFFFFLVQYSFRKSAQRHMKGTAGQLRVPSQYLEQVLIPLPPLNEQKRIVSKLEELFTKLDAGIEYLKKTQLLLKKYRQSILKYALEGKLTKKWREEHKDEIISIDSEKIKSYEKNDKLLSIDKDFSFTLPSGWYWAKTGQICEGIVPGRYKPKNFNGNIPWITVSDIEGLYVSLSKKNLAVTKKDATDVGMKIMPPNTVLMSCIGEFGIISITKNEVVPNQQFHGFVCSDKIIPEYLAFCLMIQIHQMKRMSSATTIAYMNKSKCNSITIPVASYLEQKVIVNEISRRISILENVEKIVINRIKQSLSLSQSILKYAFEGELVHQDPNDEPTEVLLERIKRQIESTINIKKENSKIIKNKFIDTHSKQMRLI